MTPEATCLVARVGVWGQGDKPPSALHRLAEWAMKQALLISVELRA